MNRPLALSGIQPSGEFTLGNYLGALKHFAQYELDYRTLFLLVDLHALTVRPKPAELRQNSLNALAIYLACGLDPDQSLIVLQSMVPEHTEFNWLLQPFVYYGELQRMTQFKDKAKQHAQNINAGLFNYPALMAADVLIYNTTAVPVGADQVQHMELVRTVAQRINAYFETDLFNVPVRLTPSACSRVMSLSNPTAKMSKSVQDPMGTILLLDPPEAIREKCLNAVTDSDNPPCIRYDRVHKPGVSNLMEIYAGLSNQSLTEVEAQFNQKGYRALKTEVADLIIETLLPIQSAFKRYICNEPLLLSILQKSALQARVLAQVQLARYKDCLGLLSTQ